MQAAELNRCNQPESAKSRGFRRKQPTRAHWFAQSATAPRLCTV